VLLDKRISTTHSTARQQLDRALTKLIERSNAFQLKTVLHPFQQLCLSLDDTDAKSDILEFIEGAFQRFMQKPFPYFDKVSSFSLVNEDVVTLSPILITLIRQWEYLMKNKPSEQVRVITSWLCDFVFRLVIIGEDLKAIEVLIDKREGEQKEMLDELRHDINNWNGSGSATIVRYFANEFD
jgi:hypothetical protein